MLRYGGTIYLMKKLDFKELHHALAKRRHNRHLRGAHALLSGWSSIRICRTSTTRSMKITHCGGSALPMEVYDAFKETLQRGHQAGLRHHRGISGLLGEPEAPGPSSPHPSGLPVPGVDGQGGGRRGATSSSPGEPGSSSSRGPTS
ncbi:MAG: hypothetical protein MZU91_02900 [Desulfosudis oleivorans]|nr:hypothetical protein [Desulfosudis oleivorans]